jgi:adenylate cyclase
MLPRFKIPGSVNQAFEEQFALEVLKNDRLRVTILIGAVSATVLLVMTLAIFFFDQFQQAFHGNFRWFLPLFAAIAGITLGGLLIERVLINRMIARGVRTRLYLRYLSALLETSMPTVGMILSAQFVGPVYSLFTPAASVYPLMIVLSALRLDARLSVFTGAVAAVQYGALAFYFLSTAPETGVEPMLTRAPNHVFRAFLLLALGVVTGLVTYQIRKRILNSMETVAERNRISRTFGEYVSPVVMEKLMTLKPDLRSEKRKVCVMFLDIRNFTAFAEQRTPEEVVEYLESLFEFMIEIVNHHNGVINKFLGDGFMAVFGAPLSDGEDCVNALAAAQEIIGRVREEVAAGNILPTRVGIGLHSGEAVTGSIGSHLRREYTVIGDVVNLASRIEQLNKRFDSELLISEMVWDEIGQHLTAATPMGQVEIKGRQQAVQVYSVN